MSFSKHNQIPGFPNDLPLVPLETLDIARLLANEPCENAKLFASACSIGMFQLDLSSSSIGMQLIDEVEEIFQMSKALFELDMIVKKSYSMLGGTVLGYKESGVGRIDAKGTPDRCEFWCMSKDDVLGNAATLPAPEIVTKHRELYAQFAKSCHEVSMLILDRLECSLDLPSGTFRQRHRIDQISSDQSRQIRYLPLPQGDRRTSLVPHTDFGSVTVVFNVLGGLQVLPEKHNADEPNWLWVKPLPGCAIINLGDAMVKFTNGHFKSPMHRVTYAPGEQAELVRYSLAYFTRPEDSCLMKAIEGSSLIPAPEGNDENVVTAGEWVRTRVKAAQVQNKDQVEFPKWATKGILT